MKKRPIYIEKLFEWKDKKIIKVITGMRRSGKSSVLDLYIEELIFMGVNRDQWIYNWIDRNKEKILYLPWWNTTSSNVWKSSR